MKVERVPQGDLRAMPYVAITLSRDEVAELLTLLHRASMLGALYNELMDFKRDNP